MEENAGMKIQRIIADFIKDYEGKIWLLNVKSIEVVDASKLSEIESIEQMKYVPLQIKRQCWVCQLIYPVKQCNNEYQIREIALLKHKLEKVNRNFLLRYLEITKKELETMEGIKVTKRVLKTQTPNSKSKPSQTPLSKRTPSKGKQTTNLNLSTSGKTHSESRRGEKTPEPEYEEIERIEYPSLFLCNNCSFQVSTESKYFAIQDEFKGIELNNNYMVTKKDKFSGDVE